MELLRYWAFHKLSFNYLSFSFHLSQYLSKFESKSIFTNTCHLDQECLDEQTEFSSSVNGDKLSLKISDLWLSCPDDLNREWKSFTIRIEGVINQFPVKIKSLPRHRKILRNRQILNHYEQAFIVEKFS